MSINYKRITESLIFAMLSDWREANRDAEYEPHNSEITKRRVATRLAALNYYDSLPISEIIGFAETYSDMHSYLNETIDTDELKRYISEYMPTPG